MKRIKNKSNLPLFFKIHIYAGLFCSIYFIIAGISALDFQHHFLNTKPVLSKTYTQQVKPDTILNNNELINFTINSLDIYGYVRWWKVWEDTTTNELHFDVVRAGKSHAITVNTINNIANIKEYRLGMGSILGGLHVANAGKPKSLLSKLWRWYVQSAAIISFLLIVTSIYLWFKKSIKNKWQWVSVITVSTLSIILILFVWLVG